MGLEKIMGSGKKILGTSLLAASLYFPAGCSVEGSDGVRSVQQPAKEVVEGERHKPKVSEEQVDMRSKIAFASNRDGNYEIYLMNSDGTNQKRLTNNPKSDGVPSWSPNGEKIAFHSNRDGNDEIYLMNSDGTNQRNLTNNPKIDGFPLWSPFIKKE